MEFKTYSSPHLPVDDSVPLMMRRVIVALLPGILALCWLFGWGVIINLLLAGIAALAAEAAILVVRRRPVAVTLQDNSALLAGLLLALAIPPLAPWWIPVLGSLVAIIIAKHLYGGLGYNPFNPAMIGYVVLLISFPLELSLWPASGSYPGLQAALDQVFAGTLPDGQTIDALSMATPLDDVRTRLLQGESLLEGDSPFGHLAGSGWLWVNIAFLLGGLWLLLKRVIQWHIPAGMLGGLGGIALLFYVIDPSACISPLFHLFSGATMLGAFFIATDPVSACTTPRGRIFFGLGIGLLTWIIRTWGGYPDGIAFAVLLMNLAAPTIDYYSRPRVFGHDGRKSD